MNSFLLKIGFSACVLAQSVFAEDAVLEESPEMWREQGRAVILDAYNAQRIENKAKNVILFIGDGMGISTVTASRILDGQMRGKTGEENFLSFEKLPYTALSKTYNTNQQTPDSAGTMSAIMTGVKTKAGFISVTQNATRGDSDSAVGETLFTLLEKAELAGKSTGIVTTARLTHATPACTYAHVPERGWENDTMLPEGSMHKDIAAQLVDFKRDWAIRGYKVDGLEVALGGGRANFLPEGPISEEYSNDGDSGLRLDGRNLPQEWVAAYKNAAYIHDLETFESIDVNEVDHLLGLFEGDHMEYETDRETDVAGEPALSMMAAKAVDVLQKNDNGFFLMVESGRIDHAHHAGNAYRALRETVEFSKAIQAVLDKVDLNETLVVVTADHSHVFTMAGYPTRGNDVVGLVVGNNEKGEPQAEFSKDALGMPYTTLGYTNGPGYLGKSSEQEEGFKTYPHYPTHFEANTSGRPDLAEHFQMTPHEGDKGAMHDHLQDSCVPLGSETHGGEDVGVWAAGPFAHLLHGTVEQNVIFHLMDFAFDLQIKDPFTVN